MTILSRFQSHQLLICCRHSAACMTAVCLSLVSESQESLVREMSVGSECMPAVKHYEQTEFSGMFEYSKGDDLVVVKKLILGLV